MDQRPLSYDVVVVGGGAAGLAAAVAAAQRWRAHGARRALRLSRRHGHRRHGEHDLRALPHLDVRPARAAQRGLRRDLRPPADRHARLCTSRYAAGGASSCPTRRSPSPAWRTSSWRRSAPDLDVYLHAYLVGRRGRRRGGSTRCAIATWERHPRAAGAGRRRRERRRRGRPPGRRATETAPLAGAPGPIPGLRPPAGRHRGARRRAPAWHCCGCCWRPSGTDACRRAASNLTLAAVAAARARSSASSPSAASRASAPDGRDFLTAAEQEGRRRVLAVTEFLKTLPPFGTCLRLPRGASGGRPREPAGDRTLPAHARRRPVRAGGSRTRSPGRAGPSSCGRRDSSARRTSTWRTGRPTTSRSAACRPATSTISSSPDAA